MDTTRGTLYLGWDVGGWEGDRDGLAALRWGRRGLELCREPVRRAVRPRRDRPFTLADLLPDDVQVPAGCRVVLGIDAPLGWPARFADHVRRGVLGTPSYLPKSGEINNKFAYRLTDRFVHETLGKKPLSAPFDKLGGNATKAMTVCRLLRLSEGAVVVPQEEDEGARVVICEAYPAPWKAGGRKSGALEQAAQEALRRVPMPPPGSDEADAVLCALTAASYDDHVRQLRRRLPRLHMPGAEPEVRQEGWIYFAA